MGISIGGTLVAFAITPASASILEQAKIIGKEKGLESVTAVSDLEKEDQDLA